MSTTAEATKHTGKTKQAAEEQDRTAPAPLDLTPDRFINREISWLAFNDRVLGEANNAKHPLLERLRFLSISASNLDEFIMVRVAALKAQVRAGVKTVTPDNLLPEQQLALINQAITKLNEAQQRCFQNLRTELREAGITVVDPTELSKEDRAWAEARFLREIFPVLTPIAVDPAHPFPFIANRGVALVLQLSNPEKSEPLDALIPLPNQLDRFIRMPGAEARFIQLEHLVLMFLDKIFPKPFKLTAHGLFRVLRDSEMEIDEESEDLVRTFETRAEAPPPRRRHQSGGRIRHVPGPAGIPGVGTPRLDRRDVRSGRADRPGRSPAAHPERAHRPALPALHRPLPGAHPRLRRQLLRRDPAQGHRRPPPV